MLLVWEGMGGGLLVCWFLLQYYSLLMIRLYTDCLLNLYPGTGRKVCGGGWWWWSYANLVFSFGPNLLV